MEANKILQADLLDLVFEGRNKDYGAYELRKKYNRRIVLALGITIAVAVAAVLATVVAQQINKNRNNKLNVSEVVLQNVTQKTDEPPPPPPPPPPKTPPPPKVEMAKFTPPVIKKDEEVKKEEIPPVEKLEDTKIDVINQEGIKDQNIAQPPPVDEGKKVVEEPKIDENQIFTKVEIEATVDPKAWNRWLTTQLQRYIEDAASNGMEPGTYTVQVKFLVERDGSIADVQALNDPGYGLSKGAVDVVKKGPKWSPGVQNGKQVRSYHTQPITFMIQDQ
jgi:periplasmic protein TonB